MAVLGEPAAKRRRLLNHSEGLLMENVPAALDDEGLISDLMKVSPWEIVPCGLPLYQTILSTGRLLAPDTVLRLFRILSQHLECCMGWRASDTDELDDQELYGTAVQALVLCLQHIYNPGVTELCSLVLARALVFLQKTEDADVAISALLQIIHHQTSCRQGDYLSGLSTLQQLEFLVALLRVNTKTSTNILTHLAEKDTFARIALQACTKEQQVGAVYPRCRTETLFEWRCDLALAPATTTGPNEDTLGVILASDTCWLDRAQALEVLVAMARPSYSPILLSIAVHQILQNTPDLSSAAVTALQYLLEDENNIGDCLKELHAREVRFLSALLQVSQVVPASQYLFPNHDVCIWAIELFWTFVSFLVEDGDNTSQEITELALSAVELCSGDEYKLFLAARTICKEQWEYFQNESLPPSLVSALASILLDKESSEVTIDCVLNSFQELVRSCQESSSHIARDRDLLDKIASLGATSSVDEASKLLFELSDHAPNRRLLVCRPRVLVAMMRFAQQQHRGSNEARYYQMRINQLADLC